jgi:hypothetical protein
MSEERVGRIVHYWPKAGAAQIELDHSALHVGDVIHIRGRGHEFKQEVLSLEIDHRSKSEGWPGEHVAIAVMEPVHVSDEVWIVRDKRV